MQNLLLRKRLKFSRAISYKQLKENKVEEIKKLREVFQQNKFISQVENGMSVLPSEFSSMSQQ
jgi:hypothetical protein